MQSTAIRISIVLAALLFTYPVLADQPEEIELFAKEDWYKGQDGKEGLFEGELQAIDPKGKVGFGRFNPYRLVMAKQSREVYVGGKPDILKPYIGKRIAILGKAVDMEVEGEEHHEIWPAKLKVVAKEADSKDKTGGGKADAVIVARGAWPHTEVTRPTLGSGDLFWIVRSADDWAKATAGAKTSFALAGALQVKEIDFAKQMVVAVRGASQPMVGFGIGPGQTAPPPPPSAPSRVVIERIETLESGALRVLWKLEPRGKDEVLTAPVAVTLLPRTTGEVKFEQVKGKDAPAAQGTELKTLASASLPDGLSSDVPARGWVVRREDELVDSRMRAPSHVIEKMIQVQLALYAKALGVEKLALGRQMIVGVAAGTQPGKRTVRIDRVAIDTTGKVMTVHWKLAHEDNGDGPSNPSEVVLVDTFEGEVKFDPAIADEGRKTGRDKSRQLPSAWRRASKLPPPLPQEPPEIDRLNLRP